MTTNDRNANWLLGLVGAVAGGAIGFAAFYGLLQVGIYALVLPGALLGLGCGMLARGHSVPLGIICGTLALALGIGAEWWFFVKDASLWFFVTHLTDLLPVTLIMIAVGGLCGFWFGRGR